MKISKELLERFCKDMKLPIKVYREDIFEKRIELLDQFYNCNDVYKRFIEVLKNYKTEQDYFEDYNRVKDSIINTIKSSPDFIAFTQTPLFDTYEGIEGLPSHEIYSIGKFKGYHLSCDIKKANFSCLKKFSKNIFDGAETWEDFVRKFTNNEHIVASKYIREATMGNCCAGKHTPCERAYLSYFYKAITERFPYLIENDMFVKYFGNDEVIFYLGDKKPPKKMVDELREFVENYTEIPIRAEFFTLDRVYSENETFGYIKNIFINGFDDETNKEIKLKCFDSFVLPSIIRFIKNEPIEELDLYFIERNMICTIVEKELPKYKIDFGVEQG